MRKPPLPAVLTGVGIALALMLAAVELLHVFDPADPAGPGPRLLGILLVLFCLQAIVVGFQGLAFLVAILGRLLGRPKLAARRGLVAGIPAAALIFVFAAPRIVALFTGPWISLQPWRPALLVFILLGGGLLLLRLAAVIARSFFATGRIGTRMVIVAAVAAPTLFLIDAHEALARKQTALHDLLAVGAILATALAGSRFTLLRWRRLGLIQLITAVLAVALVAADVIPGSSVYFREVMIGRSRLVGRVLREVLPVADELNVAVDREFLAALEVDVPTPAKHLDQALPGREKFDLVFISIDTLRYDALGITGGAAEQTPTLDEFIGRSRFFPRAWAQFPSSRFSMNAMFTGRYPTTSRLWEAGQEDVVVPFEATETSFADLLGPAGFRNEATTAFPVDFLRREAAHMTRGFDRFQNDEGDALNSSERVVARALDVLEEDRPENERLFLWVHLFDPHKPYLGRAGAVAASSARDRYRGEVTHVDGCLSELLDRIDLDRTIVVIHSDHGEEFDDHGGTGHHSSLYEEQIRVPLALRIPGVEAARIDRPMGLIDLRATLLELLGVDDDPRDQGRSQAALVLGLDDLPKPPAASFAQFREPRFVQGELDALVDGDMKIIHDRRTGLFEVYDLAVDPGETRNLALSDRALLGRMRSRLAAMRLHLGMDESPIEDRSGEALALAIAGDPAPSPADIALLGDRLRDPEPLATKALDELLAHPDGRLRRMATLRIATQPETLGRLTMRDWADGEDRQRQLEAALALSLLGSEGFREDLTFLESDFEGEGRLLGILARYAGGETVLADAVHQLLADPNNDRDLESLGFAVIGRMGDPRGLVTYYTRLILGLRYPEQRLLIQQGAEAFPFAKAAPIHRLLMRHPDRALRLRAQEWLAQHPEHQAWAQAARRAERLAQRARDLGVRPEVLEAALDFYREALDELIAVGQLDWGLVMETSFLLDVCGQRARLGEILTPLIEKLPAADDFARGLAFRFVGLASAAAKPAMVTVEPYGSESLRPGEYGRTALLVRVRVDPDGSGLVGGMGPETEYLAAVCLDSLDRPRGEPAILPLPLTALLPGEEAILAVPVLIDDGMASARRVGIRLGRADRELAPPLVIVSPR